MQSNWGLKIVIIFYERGIPSNFDSSNQDECVPAPCTHRPSLHLIGLLNEMIGLFFLKDEMFSKFNILEEAKVVTRFSLGALGLAL